MSVSGSEKKVSEKPTQVTIARWSDRFYAWLIDYAIIIASSFSVFFLIFSTSNFEKISSGNFEFSRTFEWAPISVVFFAYWVILEFKTGQSLGKKILHLKITNLKGQKADLIGIMISSFGKAFLLPIDLILGWIFTNKKRQRIFNKLGKTIVIKLPQQEETTDISYKMD